MKRHIHSLKESMKQDDIEINNLMQMCGSYKFDT